MLVATLVEVVSTSAVTVAGLAFVAYLARTWIGSRIQEAVRWESVKKENAAAIADFLAVWVGPSFDPSKDTGGGHLLEVQRRYWALALWLDSDALRALNDALAHKEGADHNEALIRVRESIVGKRQDQIAAHELIRWKAKSNGDSALDAGAEESSQSDPKT